MYAKYFKRPLDFITAVIAFIVLSPLMLILTIVGAIVMKGNPFFVQPRPGKNERIFRLIKFRTMTCAKDETGNFLPDEKRLTRYGKFLRSTSLDELPELINIVKGEMSIVGPRPQLVRDMVFMTEQQRMRHSVRPGLTGLAQVNGRNNVTWENKFRFDLKYVENITFIQDLKVVFKTLVKVFKRDGINEEGKTTAEDLGDYLLHSGAIFQIEYDDKQIQVNEFLKVKK